MKFSVLVILILILIGTWGSPDADSREARYSRGSAGSSSGQPFGRRPTARPGASTPTPKPSACPVATPAPPPPPKTIFVPVPMPEPFKMPAYDGGSGRINLCSVQPDIISREEWGAVPPAKAMSPLSPDRFIIHHSGERSNPSKTLEQAIRGYQVFHQGTRNWADVAYHFVIDMNGRIAEGRSLEWEPDITGIAPGFDKSGVINISLDGDFDVEEPSAEQIAALEHLMCYLAQYYKITPDEETVVTHGDVASTKCPGEVLYGEIPMIIEDVNAFLLEGRP